MKRFAVGIAILLMNPACVSDHPCRPGTILIGIDFIDSRDVVDGVLLKYQLDDGPLVDLTPVARPAGLDHGAMELPVKGYASHKHLRLQFAPSNNGKIVGDWQARQVDLDAGCTSLRLAVQKGGVDASELMPDAQAEELGGVATQKDATAVDTADSPRVRETGDQARDLPEDPVADLPADLATMDVAAEPDIPVGPGPDTAAVVPVAVDAAVDKGVADAGLNVPVGGRLDGPRDGAVDGFEGGTSTDVPLDATADVSQDTTVLGCVINSASYSSGAANPANPCQICQPALSASTWTTASNGTPCGSGQVCSVGICRLGCWLDGSYYPAAATKPGNACQYCNPTLSVGTWTSENDGTSCGSGQVCNAGLCGTGCWIGGTFYTSGAANPANACQTCQPGTSDTSWSNSANGANCGTGQVCSSMSCQSGCWIDSTLYSSGAAKPGNPCQTCQPGVSVTAWTNAISTTACPTGQVCTAGACQPGCSIGGTYYVTDAASPSNACQACKPGTSTTAWTSLADGAGCGTGHVCIGGTCQAVDAGSPDACAAGVGTTCGSCGGTITCSGACSVPTPSNFGAACGSCGGTVTCDDTCNVPTPPNLGAACGSCGGTIKCDGTCSVATPSSYGTACGSCGGTIKCDGTCSVATPPNKGASCNVGNGIGACANGGTIACDGSCAPTNSRIGNATGWSASAAPNGSWDWDCDGVVTMEYPNIPAPAACSTYLSSSDCKAVYIEYSTEYLECGKWGYVDLQDCGWNPGSLSCYSMSQHVNTVQACR